MSWKVAGFILVFFIVVLPILSLLLGVESVHSMNVKEVRLELEHSRHPPSDNICSGRCVIIVATVLRTIGNFSYVEKNSSIVMKVTIRIHVEQKGASSFKKTIVKTHYLPMINIDGAHFGIIPGLPAVTIKRIAGEITIWSEVSYSFEVRVDENEKVFDGGCYRVVECRENDTEPPLTYAIIPEGTGILGITTVGWAWPGYRELNVTVLAIDNVEVKDVSLKYSVNGGDFKDVELTDAISFENYRKVLGDLSAAIDSIRRVLGLDIEELPPPNLGIIVKTGYIPGRPPGCYIRFYSEAIDHRGNRFRSPVGLYFTEYSYSNRLVAILDPHILWRILIESGNEFRSLMKYLPDLPENCRNATLWSLNKLLNVTMQLRKIGIENFHHWERVSSKYNIYIAYNPYEILLFFTCNYCKAPDVIWLSNLYTGTSFVDYDLQDLTFTNRNRTRTVLEMMIDFMKRHHTGLIVTQGTLTDWIVYTGINESIKIGCRGHLGYNLTDVNVVNETTLAALLGMPQLTLWECIRDKVADILCSNSDTVSRGLTLKSIPLQISHVPLNTSLVKTAYGIENEILEGLPDRFAIYIPEAMEKGYNAYTHIGWQFAFSKLVALKAFNELRKYRSEVVEIFNGMFTVFGGNVSHLEEAIDWGLESLYLGVINASSREHVLNMSFKLTGLNKTVHLTLPINFSKLFDYIPARILALSEDGLAAIIAYDKCWVNNGYRSLYFSFEIEACTGEYCDRIMTNAVEWVTGWRFENTTGRIGGVRALIDQLSKFNGTDEKVPGETIFEGDLIIPEKGFSSLTVNVNGTKGLFLIVLHPTMDNVHVYIEYGKVASVRYPERVSLIAIPNVSGILEIKMRADADLGLNPVHMCVKCCERASPPMVYITAPKNNSVIHGNQITVEWKIINGTYNIEKVEIRLDNGTWINVTGFNNFTFENLTEGIHVISVRVVDSMGFTGQAKIITKVVSEKESLQEIPLGIIGIILGAMAITVGAFLLLRRMR